MTPPLSYPALKSVLEYVKVEKRIHLMARSKFLQRIDKAIPVYVKQFCMHTHYLSLDDFQFEVEHKPWYRNEDKKNGKLLMRYLKGRSSVNVDRAIFSCVNTSQDFSVKLDFTINKLKTMSCNLEALVPIINPRSFSLTDLSLRIDRHTNVDLEIVRSAQRVIFGRSDEIIGLEKLPNKSVYLRRQPLTDVVRIIKYWIQHGKEV
ncbi:hypothetical protein GCK72_008014 [Caenorhabditis remanei]|uniref:F-box domain-containing protein n=1 Tax=Caenorhabditis remanei TaxID=31234 RepID=A0A6A5HNY2_CAERE|nr:hypothetical protein GCK72_008014 [Caenorhabditis remanei]KAF1768053.1 hypothetical protein GCK72_008014 [Caenorhabditis remanei]